MNPNKQNEVKVKSLKKALDVLDCFLDKQPLGITDISKILHLYPSNVHDILSTYVAAGFLEQDDESAKYYLSSKFLGYAKAFSNRFTLRNIAIPYLERLSDTFLLTAYLAVPLHNEILYLEATTPAQRGSHQKILFRESMMRMHCDASGKCVLANMNPEQLQSYLNTGLEQYTQNTITDPDVLKKELLEIRKNGYAIDNMENNYLSRCVAVPISGRDSRVQGCLCISGTPSEITDEKIPALVNGLFESSRQLQQII